MAITSSHSYTEVKTVYIYPAKDRKEWEYTSWLPHVWDGELRLTACDKTSVVEVIFHLAAILRGRMENEYNHTENLHALPHYVVFIADYSLVENEAIMKYLINPKPAMGVTTVFLCKTVDMLPNSCTLIGRNDEVYSGVYSVDVNFSVNGILFDQVDRDSIEQYSRVLSSIRVRELSGSSSVTKMITFLDMYKKSSLNDVGIWQRWIENRAFESMKAQIGQRSGSEPLYLDIHEKYHGPHGLVAGTTGSGKSETLQTYILSLAVNYHPDEVSFILIDYKGGGMAGCFEGLPHLAGIITNLGGSQTIRALISINSEIKRRQAVFSKEEITHIGDYIESYRSGNVKEPMPHLIIIADEFAELKKEQNEFVRELVSASHVGRSLGVHLILATQKPFGVVDDEIWGNSRFRVCLRVQDKQDSNEMLKRPDAAYIVGTSRAFFQVGNDELFEEFQTGWSGANYNPEVDLEKRSKKSLNMINIWGKPYVIRKSKPKTSYIIKIEEIHEKIY